MNVLRNLIEQRASEIKELWFDVDGVMTPQGGLAIYDISTDRLPNIFKLQDGIISTCFVPCDEHGVPLENTVTYLSGFEGEKIMEGYRFDPRDGKAVELLIERNFRVCFISGRFSPCVQKRAKSLGVESFLGEKDKLKTIKTESRCSLDQILFIGDGIQDCETMEVVGLSIAPSDSCEEALKVSDAQTEASGGNGVISEVTKIFLSSLDMWPNK
jgi:3-deoxy-D-manno-octulosonate 8-phosphate phosphatase (KDO 8-P phosphatase)